MALTKVSTDGVKDDAITSGKIPANAVGTSELADNAVTAGKTSGVQTTINNNADNRVITGSGTANTLEGEANLTFDGSNLAISGELDVHKSGTGDVFHVQGNGTGAVVAKVENAYNSDNDRFAILELKSGKGSIRFNSNGDSNEGAITYNMADNTMVFGVNNASEKLRIQSGGGISFNGDTAAANALNDYEEGTWTPTTGNSGGGFQNIISATYTKIGRLVNVSLYAVFNSGQPNSNQIRIGGLPFQSISNIYHYAVGRLQGFASDDIVWQVGGTSDYFTPYYNNGIPTYNQVNGYYFLISGSYITDS